MSFGIHLIAPVFDVSGTSTLAREAAVALFDAGIPVRITPLRNWCSMIADMPEHKKQKVDMMLQQDLPKKYVCILAMPPDKITHTDPNAIANIPWTVFETDRIPTLWNIIFEQQRINKIWVPTHFNKNTFTDSGIDKDVINVVPEGYDPSVFNTQVEPSIIAGAKKFRFLTIMDVKFCKGYDILLEAYFKEFSNKDDVTLIFKGFAGGTQPEYQERIKAMIKNFKDSCHSTAHILFHGDLLAEEHMAKLHRASDCFVLPTRGEGWMQTGLQSMACGVPCITTNASGHLEYMNDKNSMLIKCTKTPIRNIEWLKFDLRQVGHEWWNADINDLRKKMRFAYENSDYMKSLGEKAAVDARKWTWDNTAQEAIKAILELGI